MKITSLCYIEKDNEYLMLHRTKKTDDPNHDLWIGIGGHFEEGESPEECVIRETFEETGLTLEKPALRGIVTFSDNEWYEYMFLFTADRFSGEIKECDEGELMWVKKNKVLTQLPIWDGDRIFLRLLASGEPFFSLKLRYSDRILQEAALNGDIILSK